MTFPSEYGPSLLGRRLSAALRDVASSKVQVRRAATRDLAEYVDSPARSQVVARLERLAVEDDDIEVRVQAIMAMVDGGARESVSLLVKLAQTAIPRVQQMSLLALGDLAEPGAADAVEVALEAVKSALPALRYQGLVALRNLKKSEALAPLLSGITDDDPEVRWVAVRLLDELMAVDGAQSANPLGARGITATTMNQLRPLLNDEVPRVAVAATLLLARLGDDIAIAKLPTWLSNRPHKLDRQDEEAALELIGKLRVESGRNELERRAWRWLREGTNAWISRVALAQMGDARASQSILRDLDSNSPMKCARAIEAVGRIGLKQGRTRLKYLLAHPSAYDLDTIRWALERLDSSQET